MDDFLAQAKTLANTANDADRMKVLDTLRDVQYSLETPYDTLQRLSSLHLQMAGVRLGIDLGNILHDYPDAPCLQILQNLIPAMDKDLRILIDEMVLPNASVHWQATQQDLTMKAALGSMERMVEQWYALLEEAGLRVLEIYRYTTTLHDSVIEAVPK